MAGKQKGHATWRRIAYELHQDIDMGRFQPGQRLPPLDELAKKYGVKTGVMREACQAVAGQGKIAIRNGDGTYVMPQYSSTDTPDQRLHKAIRIAAYTTGASLPAIVSHVGCKRWVMYEALGKGENLTPERCLEIIDAAEAVTGKKAPKSCREQVRRQLSQP
jgi:DNA-binding transcriptional regulator YhcF (GntR family)